MRTSILTIICMVNCLMYAAGHSDAAPNDLRYFEFAFHEFDSSETFIAATNDSTILATIESQLALPVDQRLLHINGPIDSTDGGHNSPWSWHFVPGAWVLAEVSIELCDGIPSMVENDLRYWLYQVGDFCPWMSYVAGEVIFPCCIGTRGNLDDSPDQEVNLADLTIMIDHLFISFAPPACWEEGNVDQSSPEGSGSITLSDLTVLVDHLFVTLSPLPDCP